MQRATSSLLRISSWHYFLRPRSYSSSSRSPLFFNPIMTLSLQRRLLAAPLAGWINGRQWMSSKVPEPNAKSRKFGHSVELPCNAIEGDGMLEASAEQNSESFVVRRATSLDDLQWVIGKALEEGWFPREKEAEYFFAAGLTPDFFIGELNGERITSLCAVRHQESCFCGLFTVPKSYRGQGYGQKTWDTAIASLGGQYNVQAACVLNLKKAHTFMKLPTMPGWISRRYAFDASIACKGLASSQFPSSLAQILPAGQVDFEKLFAYSADMLGTSQACKSLLAVWLSNIQESSWVAIGNTGEVVGYLIMSKTTHFPEDGYYIAPFYADSAAIARSLLKVAVNHAVEFKPGHICVDIAAHLNPEGVSILEDEVGAKELADIVFFGTNGILSKPQHKIFSAASLSVM